MTAPDAIIRLEPGAVVVLDQTRLPAEAVEPLRVVGEGRGSARQLEDRQVRYLVSDCQFIVEICGCG